MLERGALDRSVPPTGESFTDLLVRSHTRVVHIMSSATPDDGVYDQDEDELAVVLQGSATLEVDGDTVELTAGDYLVLPAHTPHRVLRTDPGTEWLAIHVTTVMP